MCGIVGFIGSNEATPIILDGLRRLEYRGYDSAGIATLNHGKVEIRRAAGKLVNLEKVLQECPVRGNCGIGHTRWATHGRPSEINAHPHCAGGIVVVHNGIIENYRFLKGMLTGKGHHFRSETDTEVIAHLIEQHFKETGSFEAAVRLALSELRGAYAVVVLCEKEPGHLIAAKLGSPLVVGHRGGEFYVASDIPAMLSRTREMIFLDDGEFVLFGNRDMKVSKLDGRKVRKESKTITWNPLLAEKGGYRHFMLKEIHEQPRAIADTLAGRVGEEGAVHLEDLHLADEDLRQMEKIFIVACGTSWHAALIGKFFIEKLARVPAEVDIASEFRYRDPIVTDHSLTLLISQSGETADTLAALREAKGKKGKTVAVCNVVESSIARESDGVIYTHAGPEIGVASTKAFTTQIVALYMLAIRLGLARGLISSGQCRGMIHDLQALPEKVEKTLMLDGAIEEAARTFMGAKDFLFLGRGNQYPIALEGALKLKEISYIHAEGYPAGEMKHGPIALIDEQMPVVILAPRNETFEKVASNMEEVRARGGRVIAVTDHAGDELTGKADLILNLPAVPDDLMPVITAVPMQLLAYHVAALLGKDVDQPRNLAKSVTVE
jgi:glucosamine--fructose-6-phosphate aminotransferase (isomerizing)